MRKKVKIGITDFFLLIIIIAGLVFSDFVFYGIRMASGQYAIIKNSVLIEDLIRRDSTDAAVKEKCQYLTDIKKFAKDSLGLDAGNSYSVYYDQKNKPAIWVVSASQPFQLKPYKWWFPILGNLSYKGFFRKELALVEIYKLKGTNLDAALGSATAWSTLGYLDDPVLSGMLKRDEGSLASLIFHELTHKRIYFSGRVEFNENLAEFVGREGAIRYLSNKYGRNSLELIYFFNKENDKLVFENYIIHASKSLDSLYHNIEFIRSPEKQKIKEKKLKEIYKGVFYLPLVNKKRYVKVANGIIKNRNAFFLDYLKYSGQKEDFEKRFHDAGGDFEVFFNEIEKL